MDLLPIIFLSIFAGGSCIISFISSLNWWKRENIHNITPSSIVNVIAALCGSLGSSIFCTLVFTGILQNLLLLSGIGYNVNPGLGWFGDCEFLTWLIIAFTTKAAHVVWFIYRQVTVDIFIIDWEQPNHDVESTQNFPRVTANTGGCIWRTYLVASELVRLQVARKLPPLLLFSCGYLCLMLLPGIPLMDVIHPMQPFLQFNNSRVVPPHTGPYYFFTVSAMTLLVIGAILYSLVILRDRFLGSRMREFISVCSWLNCSIFLRTHKYFAYYVHGRSVHPTAEFDFEEMMVMIRNEEANLVSRRGVHTETDSQTFSFALPDHFQVRYEHVLEQTKAPLQAAPQIPASDPPNKIIEGKTVEPPQLRAKAHGMLNQFLRSFLDHGHKDADFVVKWRNFCEGFFDIELTPSRARGVMYHDPKMTFSELMLFGRTWDLLVFDILLFSIVTVYKANYGFGLVAVLLVSFVFSHFCRLLGQRNIARKAFISNRFLLA